MLITTQFVDALRDAALLFQACHSIRHDSPARVTYGTIALVSYDEDSYGLEDTRTGRKLAEVSSLLPLTIISAAVEYYRNPGLDESIFRPDTRQLTFSF